MAGGRRGRRGGGRQRRVRRKLVDPGVPVDVTVLINYLRSTRRISGKEFEEFKRVPTHLLGGILEVQRGNRGLRTMYAQMAHLRRRLLRLMIDGKEYSKEGNFIREKLEIYQQEVVILQDRIEQMGGEYYKLPSVFLDELVLLK